MRKATTTLSSFTVEDDLISESSFASNIKGPNFANLYSSRNFDQVPAIPSKQLNKIREQAQQDVYKQQSDKLFNPFQHKLSAGFTPTEQELYYRERQKFEQELKRKEQQQLGSTKSYTIIFEDSKRPKPVITQQNVFKMCANQVLEPETRDIVTNNKPKKRFIESIQEENHEDEQPTQSIKRIERPKSNNFVEPSKKNIKNVVHSQKQINYSDINKPSVKKTPKLPPSNQSKSTKKPKQKNNESKTLFSEVYEGPDRALVEQLQKQLVQSPNISFEDIADLETAKNLLQEAVLLPRLMPEFFKGIRRATKGALLFGPPGTGKTLLAKAVSKGNIFFNVSASSLASKWKGQSEKLVRILFQMAKFYAPSIIFFDEIDSIGSKRSSEEHESNRKVKSELLVQMDGASSEGTKNVFVLAATNRPWDLDEALRRRLQKRIYIPLPTAQGRKKMFQINLKSLKLDQSINWDKLVNMTKEYSGADIANVCRQAAYMPMRKKLAKMGGLSKIKQISQLEKQLDIPLTEADFLEALKNVNKSVGSEDLKKYADWMKEFGSS